MIAERRVATPRPASAVYSATGPRLTSAASRSTSTASSSRSLCPRSRRASAKPAAATRPTCRPEMESTCTTPARVNASRRSASMPSSSPTMSARSTAPSGGGTAAAIAPARRAAAHRCGLDQEHRAPRAALGRGDDAALERGRERQPQARHVRRRQDGSGDTAHARRPERERGHGDRRPREPAPPPPRREPEEERDGGSDEQRSRRRPRRRAELARQHPERHHPEPRPHVHHASPPRAGREPASGPGELLLDLRRQRERDAGDGRQLLRARFADAPEAPEAPEQRPPPPRANAGDRVEPRAEPGAGAEL